MTHPPIPPADRTHRIKYAVRDILAVAEQARAAGKPMVYLNIGDPIAYDFQTPPVVIEAICQALRDGHTGYGPSPGVPAAIEAIRADCDRRGFQAVQDVFIGNGCSEVIEVALSALVNAGENILTPSPGYPLYTAIESKLELRPNPYYLDESNGWQPDLEDIAAKIDDKTRAIVLINPNNPTGSVCSRETISALIELCAKHDILIIADEIYDLLLLDDDVTHTSVAALTGEHPVLTFNGLSKAFLGPGLRIGWGILSGPAGRVGALREAIHKFLRARLCGVHPIQHAIAPALADTSHLAATCATLRARRDLTVERLNAIPGISCVPPRAAFYAFPSLEIDEPDEQYVARLVRETGVVVVHGSGFGQRPGTHHMRVVYLPPVDVLERAYGAIADFVGAQVGA